ncbi:YdcF family protein [Fusibacter bizertensis]
MYGNPKKLGKILIGIVTTILMLIINFWVFSSFPQTIIKVSFLVFDLTIFVFLRNYRGKHFINKILKKTTQYIIIVTLISVAIISILIIGNFKGTYQNDVKYDFIVIMGDAIHGKEIPVRLANRLDKGIEVYFKDPVTIIVTGGKGPGEEIPESEAMRAYLIKAGIPQSDIITERESDSTQQNISNVLAIITYTFEKNTKPNILIVSSDYHLFRIKFLALDAGLKFDTISSETPRNVFLKAFVREWFGIIKDFVYVLFNGSSTI